jgi:hypothetical protein
MGHFDISAIDPKLDTSGWPTLEKNHFGLSSIQGPLPCKMRRALLSVITSDAVVALGKDLAIYIKN